MNKQKLVTPFTILAIILILASIMLPWWTWNENIEKTTDYYLLKVETKKGGNTTSVSLFGSTGIEHEGYTYTGENRSNSIKMLLILFIMILAWASSSVFSIVANFMRKRFKEKDIISISLISVILIIVVFVIFVVLLPFSVNEDLKADLYNGWKGGIIGEQTDFPEGGKTVKWGVGIGFYLMLGGMILNIISFTFMFISREKVPMPPAPSKIVKPQVVPPPPQQIPSPPPKILPPPPQPTQQAPQPPVQISPVQQSPPPPTQTPPPIQPQFQQPLPPPKQITPPPPPPQQNVVKIKCGKCGNIIDITSPQRPIEVICKCGSKLVLK